MKPKHHKSQYFLKKGLFDALDSFSELEARISALPETERGDAFEVFAEAYFNTQSIHQDQEVWPEKQLSQELRETLRISIDAGVDGVIKTRLPKYIGYQVKFRTGRSTLAWNGDGKLSNFFGQTDYVDNRLLFTNSMDLSEIAQERKDFSSVKGNDLDQLELSDFQDIVKWLQTGLKTHTRKKPRQHQKDAVLAIVNTFKKVDRAKAIMACGSGKTLIALWVTEMIKAQNILVLVPSLALIKQTLKDWAKENNWGQDFTYIVVCSDKSVNKGIDEIIIYQYESGFNVTTEIAEVREYLENNDLSRKKIIFSTYQSCKVIAQAMPEGFAFDLAIFDEAHKTATRTNAKYALALHDKNISIKKRLFLTATPRHYNVAQKDKEGDQKIVFSMDDESIYGPVAYKLSFKWLISYHSRMQLIRTLFVNIRF